MDQIGADLAEAVERHLTEYGVRVLGGLSALNSAHPESLDLEIDAHRRCRHRTGDWRLLRLIDKSDGSANARRP